MIVGVCGFGYSGSGAIKDFLKSYDECSVSNVEFEFDLSYCPHGIQDLEYHLVERNVRYLSSDSAIREFVRLIKSMDSPRGKYRSLTGSRFREISDQFIANITQVKWKGYAGVDHRIDGWIERKFRNGVYGRVVRALEKTTHFSLPLLPSDIMYLSVHPDNFLEKVQSYFYELIIEMGYDINKIVVLDQPFEANQPENSMKYFKSPKAIIVDRDPRDLYIFAKKVLRSKGSFIPSKDVHDYIAYHRLVRETRQTTDNPNILYIKFEDMIYNYEDTSKKITDFVGLKAKSNSNKYFDPQKSINNTQLFRKYPELEADISVIEEELSEYLYPFEKSSATPTHNSNPF